MSFNIAIDGPAGAGKSTVAKALAEKLSFIYVDTGAMYRAIAVFMIGHGISAEDEEAVAAACGEITVSLGYEDGMQRVYLNGEDVSGRIRAEEAGNAASAVSAYPAVREKLLGLQRTIAAENDVVMDGRDIGTCILPGAQLKIYLTASVHIRALRRFKELEEKGTPRGLSDIERDIEERDCRDMNRDIAPLSVAEDAVILDSSDLGIDEVVEAVRALYTERIRG